MTGEANYKDIPGFPGYKAGDDGSIWSFRKPDGSLGENFHQINGGIDTKGYRYVILSNSGKTFARRVHRLILETFVGPCPAGMIGCHAPDPDRQNNRLSNLRWGTYADNYFDAEAHGFTNRGSRNGSSKIKESNVLSIRHMAAQGVSRLAIQKQFNLGESQVRRIILGETWRYLNSRSPAIQETC